jgi:hypothetical protein
MQMGCAEIPRPNVLSRNAEKALTWLQVLEQSPRQVSAQRTTGRVPDA